MTDTDQPTRQAIEAKDRSAPLQVTGKLKVALDLMVWKGARRVKAAKQAGMTDHGLRAALRKPHVKAHYLAELQVLRESERPRNILAMVEVRDGKGHKNPMARLQAAKALEGIEDVLPGRPGHPLQQLPGLVVQINVGLGAQQPLPINVPRQSPAIEHQPADPIFKAPQR
jgi:hypothetical protein